MAMMLDGQELARRMSGLYGDAKPRGLIQPPDKISATLLSSSGREIRSYASSAHLLGIVMRGADRHLQWHDDRQVHVGSLQVNRINIVPAGTTPRSVGTGVGVLHFYLPHADMRQRAAQMGRRGGDRDLDVISPLFGFDHALSSIGRLFAEVIDASDPADLLYRDSLVEALIARVLQRWSSAGPLGELTIKGGLTPRQVKRVCEMMDAQIGQGTRLDGLAKSVDLSASHFSRAFKRTTGLTPSQWAALRRVERGKEMLADRSLSLAEVALASGYAAQSAFTTAFRRATGTSPGAWRRRKRD